MVPYPAFAVSVSFAHEVIKGFELVNSNTEARVNVPSNYSLTRHFRRISTDSNAKFGCFCLGGIIQSFHQDC